MTRSDKDKARDERIVGTADTVGKEIEPMVPLTQELMSDADLDAIIGEPMTQQEHRSFYRMYLSALRHYFETLPTDSESTREALELARTKFKDAKGLGALLELAQDQAYRQMVPLLPAAVHGASVAPGRRPIENPVIEALAKYLRENPKANYGDIWRNGHKWLPKGAGIDDDSLYYRDAKGRDKNISYATFKDWCTKAHKKFSPDS